MKTFLFYQKNSSATITLSANNFGEAEELLEEIVKDANSWTVEDEDGEEEE
ncbi:MAG: hypothetical protein AABY15_06915 [Nanoarchaeota archaeon]